MDENKNIYALQWGKRVVTSSLIEDSWKETEDADVSSLRRNTDDSRPEFLAEPHFDQIR